MVSISPVAPILCNGQSVSLTASGATTYAWSSYTGLSATTGATVSANPSTTTTYTVTGTISGGCTATKTVTVTVESATRYHSQPLHLLFSVMVNQSIVYSRRRNIIYSPATGLSRNNGIYCFSEPIFKHYLPSSGFRC